MHLFKNSVSFIAILCVCGAAVAATTSASRVGVNSATATRRLSALSNVLRNTGVATTTSTTTSGTTTSSSGYTTGTGALSDTECIDDYRDCMKSDDACGSEFEECTTKVLFHGHMGECYSTLRQCSATAIESLMGTSNLSILSEHDTDPENENDITDYAYPTDSSIMGIDIIGAATRNKLSTADCVKKYKRCLNKDDVCGEDFELCTDENQFRKQATLCDSTLSRCQKDGFLQLFGEGFPTKPSDKRLSQYKGDSNIGQWVDAGARLAAQNAVNTCYKVVDNCFLSACAKNPYRCVEGVKFSVISAADFVKSADDTDKNDITGYFYDEGQDTLVADADQTAQEVRKFFRAACESTIGSNKYCQMTFLGRMPTKTELKPDNFVDLQEEIFDDAYATRNNKNILGEKINKLVEDFDTEAKNKCIDTFKSCAIRTCGGGSGAACYSNVFGENGSKTINGQSTYDDIKAGCSAVVNTDVNCKYMAANTNSDNGYQYSFSSGAFSKLFPKYSTSNAQRNSTIVVDTLNGMLNSQYNAVAIENMKKQCQNVVANCVKSMCGNDYQDCYRNRNDITVSVYNSTNNTFNNSMNKVNGILDFTIIRGLCASTVKNSDACAESFAIAKMKIKDGDADVTASWSNTDGTLSNEWNNSVNTYNQKAQVQEQDENGNLLCECGDGSTGICEYTENGQSGCSTPSMISGLLALDNEAVNTVFKEVLAEVESNAQALYNKKLTHEQNVCLAQNTGSALSIDTKPFVWAKLKSKKFDSKNYEINGLSEGASVESNDLYGSFCRVKVTLKSNDRDITNALNGADNTDRVTAYFAAGDPFTCGSWLSEDTINNISKAYAAAKTGTNENGALSSDQKKLGWGITALAAITGGVGTDLLQSQTGLGGLLGTTTIKDNANTAEDVNKLVNTCYEQVGNVETYADAVDTADKSLTEPQISNLRSAISNLQSTFNGLKGKLGLMTNSGYVWESDMNLVNSLTKSTDGSTTAGKIKTAAGKIRQKCTNMLSSAEYTNLSDNKNKNLWNNGGGRALVDVLGAGVTAATAAGITYEVMNHNNREAFTAAQKEWMNSIGSKIHCYVGEQQVGSFGDLISVSIADE